MKPTTDRRTLRVSIYSDYTCPWCYIGAARFDRLKREISAEVDLAAAWMPFEIHPEVPEEGLALEALPYSEEQLRESTAHLREQAETEGLPLTDDRILVNTHRALAAATFVQDQHRERFPEFHRRLFHAHFGEGRNLNDLAALRALAEDAGVAGEAVEQVLEAGTYDDALAATGEMARRLGISGTPTYVFENEFAVVGAHPVETLKSAVQQVLDDEGRTAPRS